MDEIQKKVTPPSYAHAPLDIRHEFLEVPEPPRVPTRRDILRELDIMERQVLDMVQQATAARAAVRSERTTFEAVFPNPRQMLSSSRSFLSELETLQKSTAQQSLFLASKVVK